MCVFTVFDGSTDFSVNTSKKKKKGKCDTLGLQSSL